MSLGEHAFLHKFTPVGQSRYIGVSYIYSYEKESAHLVRGEIVILIEAKYNLIWYHYKSATFTFSYTLFTLKTIF